MNSPTTRYVQSDSIQIAYQVVGDGPLDILYVPGFVSNIEATWQNPQSASFLNQLSEFGRLILFDKRGTGMSDRGSEIFTLEQRMHDVQAVLDAVGSRKASLLGASEGGPMSLLYAATYPERTHSLILYGSYAKRSWAPDYEFGWKDEQWTNVLGNFEKNWGTPDGVSLDIWAPSLGNDPEKAQRMAKFFRSSASPGAAISIMKMNREIDVRGVLPSIQVPTLVLHRTGERVTPIESARYLAERIPGATLRELEGIDHVPYIGDVESVISEIGKFLNGDLAANASDRVLATVLFVDIVSSTELLGELGDRKWREKLEGFYGVVRDRLSAFQGTELDTAGDGLFASFDGPARAVRSAQAIARAVQSLGLQVRCGVHTGECEVFDGKLAGIAVNTGARIAGIAAAGEVLVSRTVRDLVAGSGLEFSDRGDFSLKGIQESWQLYEALP